ncbi:MAG: hypothetical protein K9L86_06505 [Candidatus Omnitrophica bacterium]|nr:hypothetical protein [Candidatus Omnitrophota bacterium]
MVKKIILLLVIFVFGGFLSSVGFCQYVYLDAKYVQIKGPVEFKEIGVALSETACERLIAILDLEDGLEFEQALNSYDILRIDNYASAILLDLNLFEGMAKVTVLEGLQHKFSGWIPISWLDDNQSRPILSESYQFVPYEFTEDGSIPRCHWGYK